jgi:hypothetical protein
MRNSGASPSVVLQLRIQAATVRGTSGVGCRLETLQSVVVLPSRYNRLNGFSAKKQQAHEESDVRKEDGADPWLQAGMVSAEEPHG